MIRTILVCLTAGALSFPTVVTAQEPTPAATDADYQVGPEDVLRIDVWGRDELSGQTVVSFSGEIQIPLLGRVKAQGRTPGELSRDLTQRYQLLEPSVSDVFVSVVEYMSRSVTILGEVRASGRYGFREMPDVWDVILAAGGATASAELGAVKLIRSDVGSGEPRVITMDLSMGIEGTDPATLPELRPNDQILVPNSEGVPTGGAKFRVVGAVRAPGMYRLSVANDVVEALAAAGGPTVNADMEKVFLTRVSERGVVAHELNLRDYLREGKPGQNMPIQAGDTISLYEKSTFWTTAGVAISRIIPIVNLTLAIIYVTN